MGKLPPALAKWQASHKAATKAGTATPKAGAVPPGLAAYQAAHKKAAPAMPMMKKGMPGKKVAKSGKK